MHTSGKMLRLLLFICSIVPFSYTNNVDIEVSPIIKTVSQGSYFGFSITGVDDYPLPWVAVGSPKANSSKLPQNNTGALYKCPIQMDKNDCIDISENILKAQGENKPFPANGWYGVSVAGGKGEQNLLACGHRLMVDYCYNGACMRSVPGACKIFARKRSFVGVDEMDAIHQYNIRDIQGDQTDPGRTVSRERSRFGQMGLSSMSVNENAQFFAGAVGEQRGTGAVVDNSNNKYLASDEEYSYGGYSIASGAFFTPGEIAYAFGAPRYNLVGAVFVQRVLRTTAAIISGTQKGSYFGMSMCACDFDGDGISEIVIGAPYYSKSLNKPGSGRVYVYNSTNFSEPIVLEPKKTVARALFGRSVAPLGDVDLDGYNDLGVGEPYEEGGGALYVYHGSSAGLIRTPVQIIRASDLPYNLKTFGWSIGGEVDLDNNGYPDITVGAYTNDSIMILRTLPVVDVTSSFVLNSQGIDVSNRSCTVDIPDSGNTSTINTVCFDIEISAYYKDRANKLSADIELSFTLDADTLVEDARNRRVRFRSTHSSKLTVPKVMVANGTKSFIRKASAYLRTDLCPDCENKINPYPDIELELKTMIPDRPKPPPIKESGNPPSLEKYFQLPYFTPEMEFKDSISAKLHINRPCDPCQPDLKITNVGTTNIPVKSQEVQLKVEVSNTGDQAYSVDFKAVFPPKLGARPCSNSYPEKCLSPRTCDMKSNNTVMVCGLGNIGRKPKQYVINIDTSQVSNSLGTYEIELSVESENKEKPQLQVDNTHKLKLTVASTADIGISESGSTQSTYYGGSVRGQYSMTREEQIGLLVEHRYVIENKGPDDVPEVNITIEWPYQAKSGKHLLYLLEIKEDDKIRCSPEPGMVNPLADQFKERTKEILDKGTGSSRKRREVDDEEDAQSSAAAKPQERKGSTSTVVLDCRNKTAMCIQIHCNITDLGQETVSVTLRSRIWNGTLLEDYTDQDVLVYSRARVDDLTGYVTDPILGNHEAEAKTIFYPASPKTTKKGIAPWIIAVSAVAGVVLLVILIVVFKMCGFFERKGTARYDSVPPDT